MTNNTNYEWTPARKLARMVAAKEVSPVELTTLALDRAEKLNPALNAFLTLIPDQALAYAKRAEQAVMGGGTLGSLHGVPISIKDLEAVEGVRQTNGSLVNKDHVSEGDSLGVERIKASGAIIIGKTNTSEFGHIGTNENRLRDACRNPWDIACTSGASSGGAGSSVAAGITAFAQGSDGGGSIRIPSACCGIFGIKPSQGRVPRRNDNLYGWNPVNFSNVGPLARDVRDAALLLQVLAGPVEGAEAGTIPTEPPDYLAATDRGVQGLRIAFSPDLGGAPVAADVAEAARTAALSFEQLGASVETVKMAEIDPVEVFRTFETVYRTRAYAVNGRLLEENRELLTDYFIEGLEGGKQFSSTDLYNAHSRMNRWRAYMRELLTGYDLLMTPSLATTAFPIGEHPAQIDGRDVPHKLWGFTPFTYPFNMSGNPAASAPAGWSAAGLPYGLQIVGRYGDEETVLAAAAAFEGASPWADSKPAMAV